MIGYKSSIIMCPQRRKIILSYTREDEENKKITHKISSETSKWILSKLSSKYNQFEKRPVWLDGEVAVKLYPCHEYFSSIIELHSRLDPLDHTSKLLDYYANFITNEYCVVEKYIHGINLITLPENVSTV